MLACTVYLGTFIFFQIGFRRLEIAISMVSTVPFSDRKHMPWISRIPRNSPEGSPTRQKSGNAMAPKMLRWLLPLVACVSCTEYEAIQTDNFQRLLLGCLHGESTKSDSLRQPYVQLNPGRMWLKPSTQPVTNWTGQRGQCLIAHFSYEFCVILVPCTKGNK